MAIANILLVGITLPEFNSQCASHGYIPVMVPDIPSMLQVDVPISVVLINQTLIGDAPLADMERLYFLADGAPIAVFISDQGNITEGLRRALDEGTLERVYGHEVASGLAVSRVASAGCAPPHWADRAWSGTIPG